MTVYIQRVPTTNDWAEGAWAEVLKIYNLVEWNGEDVDRRILISPLNAKHEPGETALMDFEHPDVDVLYIFGPDNGHLPAGDSYDAKVYIPQLRESVTFWSHQACAVVMYDRMMIDGHH